MSAFYVYTHDRQIEGKYVPFYVGKGSGGRAGEMSRNEWHDRVVAKCGRGAVRISFWDTNLAEADALAREVELISFLRDEGIVLTNATNGGEGVSGWEPSEAWREAKSEEMKRKNKELLARGSHNFQTTNPSRKEIDAKNKELLHARMAEGNHHFFYAHPMRNATTASSVGAKVSKALTGRWIVTSPTGECRLLPAEKAEDLIKSGWVRRCVGRTFGKSPTKGRKWIHNPSTGERRMIHPDQIPSYLANGWLEKQK
jgi:hypothetical protein